jgi:hypothetical protein
MIGLGGTVSSVPSRLEGSLFQHPSNYRPHNPEEDEKDASEAEADCPEEEKLDESIGEHTAENGTRDDENDPHYDHEPAKDERLYVSGDLVVEGPPGRWLQVAFQRCNPLLLLLDGLLLLFNERF